MTFVQWCGICNSRPSDGTLKIENPDGPAYEPLVIEACQECVDKLPWKGGKVIIEENDHV